MIDFQTLFSNHSNTFSSNTLLDNLLNSKLSMRQTIIDYAKMSDQAWANIRTIKSFDGRLFQLEAKQEDSGLRTAPGNIDYNVFYRNPNAYQEPIKANILLACLRETFAKTSPAYAFFYKHILVKYHTYAGIKNQNFIKLIQQEVQEFGMAEVVTPAHVNTFLGLFEKKWADHLQNIRNQAIDNGEKPTDVVILINDNNKGHQALCDTFISELSAQGQSFKIINGSQELNYQPPLLSLLGLNEPDIPLMTRVKQQANDETLYQALNVLRNRISPFVRDNRMDVLRHKTILCSTIISLDTSAHAARLAADGKTIIFDTFDSGLINERLMQLARHQIKHNLTDLKFLIRPPEALIKNDHGYLSPIPPSEAFYMTRPDIQPIKQCLTKSFKPTVGLPGEHLSTFAFDNQSGLEKASRLLKVLISNEDYPEKAQQKRDIVLVVGTERQKVIEELHQLLAPNAQQVSEKTITYHGSEFRTHSIAYHAQKTLHIWSGVSVDVLYTLSQASDHFIINPTATNTAHVLSWQVRGGIAYYDTSHPSEKGNLTLLATQGADIIYDTTPASQCRAILKKSESTQLDIDPIYQQYPTVTHTVMQILSHQAPSKPSPTVPLHPTALDDESVDIYSKGIRAAVTRIMNAQKGILEKDSDRVITLAPTTTQAQLSAFFNHVIHFLKILPTESIDSIGTPNEDPRILQCIHLLQETQQRLLITEASVSILPGKTRNKTLIGWTGFPAMNAAMRDPSGVCNFDIPILNMLFMLWDTVFCQPRCLNESEGLSRISPQYPATFLESHPIVKQMKSAIHEDIKRNPATSSEAIARKYFGSQLTDEDRLLADKLGALACKIFVREFHHPFLAPIFYLSINKLKEFDSPVLAMDSNGWNEELPLLRQLSRANKIRFKSVLQNGLVTEMSLDEISLVKNRGFHKNVLQDREYYNCGMPSLIEWSIYSSQPPRPTTPIASIKKIINKWRFFAQEKTQLKVAAESNSSQLEKIPEKTSFAP